MRSAAPPDTHITAQQRELDIVFLPCDPECHVSGDNFVVVDKIARRVLLKAFCEGGAAHYMNELQALE